MKIFLYNHTFILIVLRTNLNDFFVSYQLNSFIDKPKDIPAIYSRLHQNILDKFSEACIEIMSPAYMAQWNSNKSTVPKEKP